MVIVGESGVRLFGLTLPQRTERLFARIGVPRLTMDAQGVLALAADGSALPRDAGSGETIIVVRADAVLDPALARAVAQTPGLLLVDSEEARPLLAHVPAEQVELAAKALLDGDVQAAQAAGWRILAPAELPGAAFQEKLRKREAPYALLLRDSSAAARRALEWRVFMGTYKGATDVITKRVWPRPAFIVTRWLAEHTRITPNMVTLLSAVLVVLAFGLFAAGHYGWGLLAAWGMTFLDTVDGKLARTTLTSSRFGDIFDHGIDLVHPPFWYAAWAMGLAAHGTPLDDAWWWGALIVIIAGYVIQRLMEGVSIALLGMEIHIWRPFDTWFREITARRNPNLVLLTVFWLVGRPDWGLLAVAAWTLISLVVHGVQLVQAFAEKRRNGRLVSWMAREGA